MSLKVIGNYGKSFMGGLIPGQNLLNFRKLQKKPGKLSLINMTKKIDTIIDFFLTKQSSLWLLYPVCFSRLF